MTWRDSLRRVTIGGRELIGASFRGVGFFVESADRAGGRRVATHQFPFRDAPYLEDLGRDAETFRVEGYLVGDDYIAQREALIEALVGTAGAGELVHPYHGVKRAICVRYATSDSRTSGGFAPIAIDFAEAPAQALAPTIEEDAEGLASSGADAALLATEAELGEAYDVAGLPAFALTSAEAALERAATALGERLAPVIASTQEAAKFAGRIDLLTKQAASLVRAPADALGAFHDAITGLADTIEASTGRVLSALLEAYAADFGPAPIATTATRARELANHTAIVAALRRVLALEAARIAPLVPYESIDDATATRDAVAALLEEQASIATDTAYPALVELRTRILRAVPGGAEFARVVTVQRQTAIPSLLLAYQLYGNIDRELDIVARNKAIHPGFLAGDLKALSDG